MKSIKDLIVGNKRLQFIFERLHRISLRGMNYGLGGMIKSSGELWLLNHVKQQLNNKRPILVDVGANDGQYVTALYQTFERQCTIYAFEPSRHAFRILQSQWEGVSNMKLMNCGLADVPGEMQLYFNEEGSGWASLYKRQLTEFNKGLTKSEHVKLITLDGFCTKNGVSEIDFMKIDVEGFEMSVLKGATSILNKIKYIQFEFSFANYDSKTYLRDFFELLSNFRIYRVLQNGLSEIHYDPRYEIMMTSNYLAVNKELG